MWEADGLWNKPSTTWLMNTSSWELLKSLKISSCYWRQLCPGSSGVPQNCTGQVLKWLISISLSSSYHHLKCELFKSTWMVLKVHEVCLSVEWCSYKTEGLFKENSLSYTICNTEDWGKSSCIKCATFANHRHSTYILRELGQMFVITLLKSRAILTYKGFQLCEVVGSGTFLFLRKPCWNSVLGTT